jgi:hypothetical protein
MNRKEAYDHISASIKAAKAEYDKKIEELENRGKEIIKYTDATTFFSENLEDVRITPVPDGFKKVNTGKIQLYDKYLALGGWARVMAGCSMIGRDVSNYMCIRPVKYKATPKAEPKPEVARGMLKLPKGWEVVMAGVVREGDMHLEVPSNTFHSVAKRDVGRHLYSYWMIVRKTGE